MDPALIVFVCGAVAGFAVGGCLVAVFAFVRAEEREDLEE
jgi:hypothetical protein